MKPKIVEVYLKDEFYNPRVRATIPGAWIAVADNGLEVAICRPWEAKNEAEARKQIESRL